jgi:hypothetical protein
MFDVYKMELSTLLDSQHFPKDRPLETGIYVTPSVIQSYISPINS